MKWKLSFLARVQGTVWNHDENIFGWKFKFLLCSVLSKVEWLFHALLGQLEDDAIEFGAEDIEEFDESFTLTCSPNDFAGTEF